MREILKSEMEEKKDRDALEAFRSFTLYFISRVSGVSPDKIARLHFEKM